MYLLLLLTLPLCGQVSVLSVSDEDKHTDKQDFWHTFEYYIVPQGNNQASKCQATRVAKHWFVTAAHCVAPACQNGCKLRMDLLEQPISVVIDAKHTAKKPIVFIHPQYKPGQVAHDFALLKMDLTRLPAYYYRRPTGQEQENKMVSYKTFQNFLKQTPVAQREYNRALRPNLPPLLIFDDATKRIDRKLSVISIFDGKRHILHNPYPSDYVKELGFAYTQNFGVKKGMSGSGVMTNTGELAGIIAAYVVAQTVGDNASKKNYFMFAVFNPDLVRFMQQTMGSDYDELDKKDASPNYVIPSPKNHTAIIEAATAFREKK